jgi:hypothetical protein
MICPIQVLIKDFDMKLHSEIPFCHQGPKTQKDDMNFILVPWSLCGWMNNVEVSIPIRPVAVQARGAAHIEQSTNPSLNVAGYHLKYYLTNRVKRLIFADFELKMYKLGYRRPTPCTR